MLTNNFRYKFLFTIFVIVKTLYTRPSATITIAIWIKYCVVVVVVVVVAEEDESWWIAPNTHNIKYIRAPEEKNPKNPIETILKISIGTVFPDFKKSKSSCLIE